MAHNQMVPKDWNAIATYQIKFKSICNTRWSLSKKKKLYKKKRLTNSKIDVTTRCDYIMMCKLVQNDKCNEIQSNTYRITQTQIQVNKDAIMYIGVAKTFSAVINWK